MPFPRLNASLAIGVLLTVPFLAPPAMAEPGAAHAHPTGVSQSLPAAKPSGQRWATDPVLRDSMDRIRQAVAALDHLQHGHVPATLAPTLAGQIQSAVNDMIAGCKLAPDADAALHGLLVKFIAGADAVRTGPVTVGDLKPMQDALARYPVLFDDPTWAKAK